MKEISKIVSNFLPTFGLSKNQTQDIKQFVCSATTGFADTIQKIIQDVCARQATGN
jgi:hypothetical protein